MANYPYRHTFCNYLAIRCVNNTNLLYLIIVYRINLLALLARHSKISSGTLPIHIHKLSLVFPNTSKAFIPSNSFIPNLPLFRTLYPKTLYSIISIRNIFSKSRCYNSSSNSSSSSNNKIIVYRISSLPLMAKTLDRSYQWILTMPSPPISFTNKTIASNGRFLI